MEAAAVARERRQWRGVRAMTVMGNGNGNGDGNDSGNCNGSANDNGSGNDDGKQRLTTSPGLRAEAGSPRKKERGKICRRIKVEARSRCEVDGGIWKVEGRKVGEGGRWMVQGQGWRGLVCQSGGMPECQNKRVRSSAVAVALLLLLLLLPYCCYCCEEPENGWSLGWNEMGGFGGKHPFARKLVDEEPSNTLRRAALGFAA